jgi:hypothetical protein
MRCITFWEREQDRHIVLTDVTEPSEYASYLRHWTGPALENARVVQLAEIQPVLNYPTGLVCLAEVTLDGQPGWVALDGPRSAWYGQAEMPETLPASVLSIHLGRQLLGFTEPAERRRYYVDEQPQVSREKVVEIYERLLDEADAAAPEQLAELLREGSPLSKHFERYVDAVTEVRGFARQGNFDRDVRSHLAKSLPYFWRVGDEVPRFLRISLQLVSGDGRSISRRKSARQAASLVPAFPDFLGTQRRAFALGETAVKCGLVDLAEHNLRLVRQEMDSFYRARTDERFGQNLAREWKNG